MVPISRYLGVVPILMHIMVSGSTLHHAYLIKVSVDEAERGRKAPFFTVGHVAPRTLIGCPFDRHIQPEALTTPFRVELPVGCR